MTQEAAGQKVKSKPAQNLMDRARARREALAADHTLTLELPGYRGVLRAVFAPLTQRQTQGLIDSGIDPEAIRSAIIAERLEAAAGVIAAACREVQALDESTGEWLSLADPPAPPVRFDARLTEGLGLPAADGAAAVLAVLNAEGNPAPTADLFVRLSGWLQDADRQVGDAEALLGESAPTR